MKKTYLSSLPYLLTGFIIGGILTYLSYADIKPLWPWCWASLYGLMFLFAYENKNTIGKLLVTTAIFSFIAALPFNWSSADSIFYLSAPQVILLMINAYALNVFHVAYQKDRFSFQYPVLFQAVWNTGSRCFISVSIAIICIWLLFLWCDLFRAIGITFFCRWLQKSWMLPGLSFLFFSVGIYINVAIKKITDQLQEILLIAFKYLFPFFAISGIAFILSWFYVAVWTKQSITFQTDAFLAFSFFSILFLNAAYRDGNIETPYHKIIRWIISVFIVIAPVFSALAIYGFIAHADAKINYLGTLVNASLLCIYNLSYAFIVLRFEKPWLASLRQANIYLAYLLILTVLVTNNPWIHSAFPK